MIYLTKLMPDGYEPKTFISHTELEEYFNAKADSDDEESTLFIARQDAFKHVVGLAGVEIIEEENSRIAVVTEMVVDPRVRGQEIGRHLVNNIVSWSQEQQASSIKIDVSPDEATAADILKELDFKESPDGKLELDII